MIVACPTCDEGFVERDSRGVAIRVACDDCEGTGTIDAEHGDVRYLRGWCRLQHGDWHSLEPDDPTPRVETFNGNRAQVAQKVTHASAQ